MVVGLYAAVEGEETFLLTALVSERIIVRVTTLTLNEWTDTRNLCVSFMNLQRLPPAGVQPWPV